MLAPSHFEIELNTRPRSPRGDGIRLFVTRNSDNNQTWAKEAASAWLQIRHVGSPTLRTSLGVTSIVCHYVEGVE
jgi:hypothetical protein